MEKGKRSPTTRSPPLQSIGTIETVRLQPLQASVGGALTLQEVVKLITSDHQTQEDLLSWRVSGSLQQIFKLEVL